MHSCVSLEKLAKMDLEADKLEEAIQNVDMSFLHNHASRRLKTKALYKIT